MLSVLLSSLLRLGAAPLLALLAALRRWQLGRRGVLSLTLSRDLSGRAGLADIARTVELLDALALDPLLRAVELHIRHPGLGFAAAQEVADALRRLREAGKLVVVHLEVASNQDLLLASQADRVWLEPAADLALSPVGAELTFFGGLLEAVGARFEVETAGAYKSFGESWARRFASPRNREAMQELVGDLGRQWAAQLAEARGLSVETLADLVEGSPGAPERALEAGLIDGVGHADQLRDALAALLGRPVQPVAFRGYARLLALERALQRWGARSPRLAVVHLEGPVVHGVEPSGGGGLRIDADRVVPLLEQLAQSERHAAVVLYIDSPGGSALASDRIARAVRLLGQRKPTVAVLADTAASGGYYIAAPCAEIVARPGTITGSIGVVGGKLDLSGLLAALGISSEPVRSQPGGLDFGPYRPLRPSEREQLRAMLLRSYDRFLDVVAAGRRRPRAAIEPHAQGRVWTGRQAQERGLVDHLGGLREGLARARSLSGLSPSAPVEHLHVPPPRLRLLAQLLGRDLRAPDLFACLETSLGAPGRVLTLLRAYPLQPLALLPWSLSGRGAQGSP